MQVLNATNERDDLLLVHDRLRNRLGLWHGDVKSWICGKKIQLLRHPSDRSNIHVAMPNYRLGVHCGQLVEPNLNFERAELSKRNASKMLNKVVVDLVGIDSAVSRAPCTLAHRKIPLTDKPPKC